MVLPREVEGLTDQIGLLSMGNWEIDLELGVIISDGV
jgi:hypothetical protein